MVPEPFLWPVEVLMGPSAGHLGALLAEQGLPLSACAAAASPPVRCLPATTPPSSGCWGRSCRGERGGYWLIRMYQDCGCWDWAELFRVDDDPRDLGSVPPWWRLGFDGKALLEAFVGTVVGLIALFSSYVHVNLPHRQLLLHQQSGVWLIALSPPLVFAGAQLAARSRQRDAAERAREALETAQERDRVARLGALLARLDVVRLAFQFDPSANNRRKLQRLLSLLSSSEMSELYRLPLS